MADVGRPPPPDGGWGWAVVFGSFMIHLISGGVSYTFAIFMLDIADEFQSGSGLTSGVASIMVGMTNLSGPLTGAFVNEWGCRIVAAVGSLLAALGFGLSYFAQHVAHLYITIGVLGGFGMGLMYLPAIVSVSCYFEKRRAFATGIAVCGSGIGTFTFAPLMEWLVTLYGWRICVVITSGIIAQGFFVSLLFKPLPDLYLAPSPTTSQTIGKAHELPGDTADQLINDPSALKPSESVGIESGDLVEPLLVTEESRAIKELGTGSLTSVFTIPGSHHLLSTTLPESSNQPVLKRQSHKAPRRISMSAELITNREDIFYWGSRTSLERQMSITDSLPPPDFTRHSVNSRGRLSSVGSAITNREDILYSGSFTEPPKELSKSKSESDEVSVASEVKRPFYKCAPEFTSALKRMMDFSLLKRPLFLLFAVSNFFFCIGYNVPFIYLIELGIDGGNPKSSASYLLSIIGIFNTLSRISLGYLSDKTWVNRLYVNNVALIVAGIATGITSHATNIFALGVYAAVFGVMIGVFVSLNSVILVDLVGLSKLTTGFGLLLLFQGAAFTIGPPIVGQLIDEFDDYLFGFWLVGAMMTLSGLMLFFIPCFPRSTKRYEAVHKESIQSAEAVGE